MKIRHNRMITGKVYTVYAIREKKEMGHSVWYVFCGSSSTKPRWRRLSLTQYGKPYFWLDNTKLYLDEFSAA